MDTMPESFNGGVTQASEHCATKVAQRSSCKRSSSIPLRRSERLRLMNVQVEQRSISLEKLNLTSSVPEIPVKNPSLQCPRELTGTKPTWLTSACSSLNQEKNMPSSGQNCKKRGRSRKLIQEDGGNSNAQAKYINVNNLKLGTGEPSNMSKQKCDVAARPVSCPIWRGSFSVCSKNFGLMDGLAAHMSNKASTEVFGVARLLPALLQSQMIPRLDVWPESFNNSPPTDNVVDLYIFPENERSERVFDSLLNYMTGQDLAMKAVVDDIVLLVFTSLQLPYPHWRTLGKYYLWAVFSGKNTFFPYPQDDHHPTREIVYALPSNFEDDMGSAIEDERNLSKDRNTQGHQEGEGASSGLQVARTLNELIRGGSEIEAAPTIAHNQEVLSSGLQVARTLNELIRGGSEIEAAPTIAHNQEVLSSGPQVARTLNELITGGSEIEAAPTIAHNQEVLSLGPQVARTLNELIRGGSEIEAAPTIAHNQEVLSSGLQVVSTLNELIRGGSEIEAAPTIAHNQEVLSSGLQVTSALNELIRGGSEVEAAPTIAHNQELFLTYALQGCDEGQGAHSLDREGSQTSGTSVLHMASAFDEMNSDEANLAVNSAEQLSAYPVKQSLAPILHAIIDKHGDIARDCPLKCSTILTSALERVCTAVQDFEAVNFINLRSCHLKSLYSAIKDAELVNLDVKWLHNRYNEVMEMVNQIKQYKNMKVSRNKNIKAVESKKRALELKKTKMMKLQSDIQLLESEVASMAAKNESLNSVICSVKSKSKHFCRYSLMDGLL